MPFRKLIALVAAALAALVVIAGAALWLLSRTDLAARIVADQLATMAGLPVSIESVALGWLPGPHARLSGLSVGQPAAFDGAPLLELERAAVSVPWRTLLGGPARIESLSAAGAVLRPIVDAEGRDNWGALVERMQALAGAGESRFDIGRLQLDKSRVLYQDRAAGTRLDLTGIAVKASDIRPQENFPFELLLAGERGAHTFHLSVDATAQLDPDGSRYRLDATALRGWLGGGTLPLSGAEFSGRLGTVALDMDAGTAALSDGALSIAGIDATFRFKAAGLAADPVVDLAVEVADFAPRPSARALGQPLPATRDAAVFRIARLTATVQVDERALAVTTLSGKLDDSGFSGRATLPFGEATPQLWLSLDQLDLDRYLPPKATATGPEATIEELAGQLAALDIDAEIKIEDARAGGARMRGLRVRIEPGRVTPE